MCCCLEKSLSRENFGEFYFVRLAGTLVLLRDQAFCSLLKRDVTSNIKAKGNPLVSVLVCNVLTTAFLEEENWPESFVKVCSLGQHSQEV